MKTQAKLSDVISQHKISMWKLNGTPWPDIGDQWRDGSRHFRVILKRPCGDDCPTSPVILPYEQGEAHRMFLYYSMGSAIKGDPQIKDILSCIIQESALLEGSGDFEDWADELGYDTDSRKAEGVYNDCVKQRNDFREFLGENLYHYVIYEVENDL